MKGLFRSKLFLSLVALVMVLLLTVTISQTSRARAASSSHSEQVIFSGAGFSQSAQTPIGFWIWCEADSSNPYFGQCNGSMYFYAKGIVKHVDEMQIPGIQEVADGDYKMTVGSSDGSVSCTLENVPPPTSGPTNTVHIICTAPVIPDGLSTKAVVNATGP